jgi:hypothetical protein
MSAQVAVLGDLDLDFTSPAADARQTSAIRDPVQIFNRTFANRRPSVS